MPELPEVETIVSALAPRLTGRVLISAEFLSSLVLRHCIEGDPQDLVRQSITQLERRGKFILIHLERHVLVIHLGMTGKLLLDAERTPYTRAIFGFDGGTLFYEDIRQFGSIEWSSVVPQRIERLGPEPFDITPAEFFQAMRARRTPVKSLLLNQQTLRGLGNIYVDESLWRAGIHPRRLAGKLSITRATRLLGEIQNVLHEAIHHRGSSISDYVDADGRKGGFQLQHRVYGREGKPCANCGTPIRRIVVGQRGTHYCPKCQR
ncbi:MAG: bifunctional DNA-formamidopyrimidine glycosylase/DNA-(apurinic or apyrimidinic site) lyase [Bryobacteraceae bacterium]